MTVTNDWNRFCKFTVSSVDKTKIDEDLIDFPISIININLPVDMIISGGDSNLDGSDIRITTDLEGKNECTFEIVNYSLKDKLSTVKDRLSATNIEIHIKIPSVSTTKDTTFYVWYNNSSIKDSGSSKNVLSNSWNPGSDVITSISNGFTRCIR
jgi:hypothetical protein